MKGGFFYPGFWGFLGGPPLLGCGGGGGGPAFVHDPHRLFDEGEIAGRGTQRRVLETDANMAAARDRFGEQRTEIGVHGGDHPRRRARFLLK